jgi:pseudouridine-5'-phosphate glycosidase
MKMIEGLVQLAEGIDARRAVALETTIVTHGLPRPQNLETARACEAIVREQGAQPATVALWEGRVRVGLDDALLERLASTDGVAKTNLSNLGAVLASGSPGATSVSTTLLAANLAGLRVAATGGIGGVHRGWERTLDISADLVALERTPVVLVCAGAKSILDVAATREQLETRGVPVIGWQTERFPLFFSRGVDVGVDARADDAAQVAAIARAHWSTGQRSAVLVVAEPPADEALDVGVVEKAIAQAVAEAEASGATGRDATPFVLSRLVQLTGGATLRANLALIRNNCRIAAQVAVALAGA